MYIKISTKKSETYTKHTTVFNMTQNAHKNLERSLEKSHKKHHIFSTPKKPAPKIQQKLQSNKHGTNPVHQNNIMLANCPVLLLSLNTNRSKDTNMSGSQTRAFQGGSPEPKKKRRNADDIDLEPVCLL